MHDDELLKELPGQLRTAIVAHVLRGIFDTSHLFAVRRFALSGRISAPSSCTTALGARAHGRTYAPRTGALADSVRH